MVGTGKMALLKGPGYPSGPKQNMARTKKNIEKSRLSCLVATGCHSFFDVLQDQSNITYPLVISYTLLLKMDENAPLI